MNLIKNNLTIQELTPEATLHQIIAANSNAPYLLQSIGLDPSGQADKTLRQVCLEKKWNEVELLEWIKKNPPAEELKNGIDSLKKKNRGIESSALEICNFLNRKTLPVIEELFLTIQTEYERVSKIHGMQHTWLNEAKWHVNELLSTLRFFIKFEKETFYPLVNELQQHGERILDGSAQNLKRSLNLIKDDHDLIKKKMQRINNISNHFHFDESACSTLRILCNRLETFFDVLTDHIEIEEKKLLPEIEKKLDYS